MDILVRSSDNVIIDIGNSITTVSNGVKVDDRIYPNTSLYDVYSDVSVPGDIKPRKNTYNSISGFGNNSAYEENYNINSLGNMLDSVFTDLNTIKSYLTMGLDPQVSNIITNTGNIYGDTQALSIQLGDLQNTNGNIQGSVDGLLDVFIDNNEEIFNGKISFNDSDVAGTTIQQSISVPSKPQRNNVYELMIFNPSSVTDITVNIDVLWTDVDSTSRLSRLLDEDITVSSNSGVAKLIQGSLIGDGCEIVISNVGDLGASDGFSVYLQLRKI